MSDANRVYLAGSLVSDPDLEERPGGLSVCNLRITFDASCRAVTTGKFESRPQYFDVRVVGPQASLVARHLRKGREVLINGYLEREIKRSPNGDKLETILVVARSVRFVGSQPYGPGGSQGETTCGPQAMLSGQ